MSERSGNRSRKRSRSRGRGGGGGNGQAASPKKQGSPKRKAPKVDPADFWGDPSTLPGRREALAHPDDVKAVLTSLGRPPMTGNETPAEHWFSLVYERAAFLAGALAAAGGLDRDEIAADDHG